MTKKPCPACGEVRPSRPADKVCLNCEGVLKIGRAEIARRVKEEPEMVLVACPTEKWAHSIGYISWVPDELRKTIQKAFVRVVRSFDKGVRDPNAPRSSVQVVKVFEKGERLTHGNGYPVSFEDSVYLERETAETLRLLFASIQQAVDEARENGVDAGKSFLARVAEGEMRLTDLNRGLEPKKGQW